MAKKKKRSSKKMPLRILEKRAAHLVNTVLHRGGHVPGVTRRAKHRRKKGR